MADPMEKPRTPSDRKKRFQSIVAAMEQKRQSFDARTKDIADYQAPTRVILHSSGTQHNRGQSQNSKIIDSTAGDCLLVLESGMVAGATSPASPWKRVSVADPDLAESGNVKAWLHDVDRGMDAVFHRSNIYDALSTLYGDAALVGTGCMLVDEDPETVIRAYNFPFGSYWLATDARRQVRVFARKFKLTTRQLVEQFGELKVTTVVRDQFKRAEYDTEHDLVHLILPNEQADPNKLEAKFKPFLCVYYLETSAANDPVFLMESGYDEWPILAFRWAVRGEDVYGTDCPGMIVNGDVKALQLGEKRKAQAIDKMVNPPMVAQPGMRNAALSGLPGTVSYVADLDGKGFRPLYQIQPDITALEGMLEQIRQRIRRGYRTDLFLMLAYNDQISAGQPRTAKEIEVREQEKMVILGSLLLRLNPDVLDLLIDRAFGVMMRRGLIPEPPEELEGMPLQVKYISMMHKAQERVGLVGIEQYVNFALNIFERTQDASRLDKVDLDQVMDEYGDKMGIPPRLIVSDEQVAELRAGRAKAQEMAEEAALLKEASAAAKNLAQAPTDGKNALTDIMAGAAA